jgi:hypothetical protein
LEYLSETGLDLYDRGNARVFAVWVIKDILKEEKSEVQELGLKEKAVESLIKTRAFKWYNEDLNRRIAEGGS